MSSNQEDPPPPAKKDPYEVGYKKPPVASRFRHGNRAAARRHRRPESPQDILRRVMEEPVRITRRGRSRSVPAFEALIRSLFQRALGGDLQALQLLLKYWNLLQFRPSTQDIEIPDYAAEVRAKLQEMADNLRANRGVDDDDSSK